MTDRDRGRQGLDGTGIISSIVQALSANPLYLLIFGIIFLTLLFCFYSFTLGAAGDEQLRLVALGGLIAESVLAFFLIRSLETARAKARIVELEAKLAEQNRHTENLSNELSTHDEQEINISNEPIRQHLLVVIDNVRRALSYRNPVFHEELESSAANFERESGEWANGCLTTDGFNYERIVWKFYSQAKATVFATSNEHYLGLWRSPDTSKRIIDAHQKAFDDSRAMVTRVFVFAKLTNVTPEHLSVLKDQASFPFIKVRILVLDQHGGVRQLTPKIMNDFVIIDKGLPTQAIGIESTPDLASLGAKWIFSRSPEIEQMAQWMEQMSISLDRLKEQIGDG